MKDYPSVIFPPINDLPRADAKHAAFAITIDAMRTIQRFHSAK